MKKLTALLFMMASCKSFVFTGNESMAIDNAWIMTNNSCTRGPATIVTMSLYKPVFYLHTEQINIQLDSITETPCGEWEGVDKYGVKYTIRFDISHYDKVVYITSGMDHITISTKQICNP